MAVDVLKLKREYQALVSDRSREEVVWDDIEKYIMPLTGQTAEAIRGSTTQEKTDVQLWDLTAPLANEHLASALHGDVTTPSTRWLDLEWLDEELERDHEAVVHREKLAELVWLDLQASDFNMEISSGYLEYSGLGNMALVVEPVAESGPWRGLDFTAVPIRQVQFVEDSRGGVLRWYRQLSWTPVQIVDHCERAKDAKGKPLYQAPERIRKMAEADDGATRKLAVVFAIFRRAGIPDEVEGEVIPEKRPFGYAYFTLDEAEQLGEEGGYYKMPAVMVRWGKRPGSQWGYGRGHIALRAVKWLNAFKELQRNAAEKSVDPAHGVSERVAQAVDMRPGSSNVMPSKEDWWPLESAARFDVSAEVMRDERAEIRRAFHEDDLQLKESPQMTATEVQARKDQMRRAIGSPAGRLETDGLVPVVYITLDHLARAGKLPEAPEIVRRKEAEFKVRFRGPIARAQVMDEVVAIEREAAFVANLLKLGFTEARHYFNLQNAIKEHAKRLGVPTSVLNSPAEAKRAVEQERAMMAAAQAAQTAKNQGQALAAASAAGIGIEPAPGLVPSGGVTA